MLLNWRQRACVLALAVLPLIIGAAHVVLWHDHLVARADAAGLRDDRATVEHRIDRLSDGVAGVRLDHALIAGELAAAVRNVRSLTAVEAQELGTLESRREEHRQLAVHLDATRAALRDAAVRSERNDALLRALHDCLDGATRAGNALSVGDVRRALAALDAVRDACADVQGVVGR